MRDPAVGRHLASPGLRISARLDRCRGRVASRPGAGPTTRTSPSRIRRSCRSPRRAPVGQARTGRTAGTAPARSRRAGPGEGVPGRTMVRPDRPVRPSRCPGGPGMRGITARPSRSRCGSRRPPPGAVTTGGRIRNRRPRNLGTGRLPRRDHPRRDHPHHRHLRHRHPHHRHPRGIPGTRLRRRARVRAPDGPDHRPRTRRPGRRRPRPAAPVAVRRFQRSETTRPSPLTGRRPPRRRRHSPRATRCPDPRYRGPRYPAPRYPAPQYLSPGRPSPRRPGHLRRRRARRSRAPPPAGPLGLARPPPPLPLPGWRRHWDHSAARNPSPASQVATRPAPARQPPPRHRRPPRRRRRPHPRRHHQPRHRRRRSGRHRRPEGGRGAYQ